MKILLAEDDASIRSITSISLKKVGKHTITAVVNGREAVELAQKESFDLIILDVMMPEMDGFQACKELKASEKTKNTPVIFLTAKAQATEVQLGLSLGAIGYVLKPFDPMKLHEEIEHILNLKNSGAKAA